MNTKSKIIKATIIFLIALSLTLLTLFSGDNIVLKDNGDFGRIIRLSSLEKSLEGELSIVLKSDSFWENLKNILFTPYDVSTYPSSQLVFVRTSVAINFIINNLMNVPLTNYNLYYFGVLLSIMYALALSFALSQINLKNKYSNWAVIFISLIVMCDIGYVSYFNSLYAEGIQHILLIALAGYLLIIIKRKLKISELLAFAVTLIFYGQSKFFNVPIAVIIGMLFFVLSFKHICAKKDLFLHGGAVLLAVVFLIGTMVSLPDWISRETNYNSVFYGIVKDCSDEEAKSYLEKDLSLNSELYVLKNTNHYVSNFHEIDAQYDIEAVKEISKTKLVMFYLKHPFLTVRKAFDIAEHSGVIRNIFFMNENYMNDLHRVTLWSRIRENSGFNTVLLNLTIILFFLGLLIKSKMPKYIKISTPILTVMIFAYSYIVPYISNGEADLAKHMFTFIEFIDIALIFILVSVLNSKRNTKIVASAVFAVILLTNIIPHRFAQPVSFGGYEWYVISENDDYKTLIAKDVVTKKPFNSSDDNNYKKSDIHKWLNEEFINNFSVQEKEQLYLKDEKIVLSRAYVEEASSGNRDFYCSAFPKRMETNYQTAYSQTVSGYAFLPTAEHISLMAKKGYNVALKDKFWVSTPYFSNSEKGRYVNPDGLIYFDYTSVEMGIRPLIYIKADKR